MSDLVRRLMRRGRGARTAPVPAEPEPDTRSTRRDLFTRLVADNAWDDSKPHSDGQYRGKRLALWELDTLTLSP